MAEGTRISATREAIGEAPTATTENKATTENLNRQKTSDLVNFIVRFKREKLKRISGVSVQQGRFRAFGI